MGHHASEALGDYCAGPNHVLPTGRTARFSSPLGVYDFQKRSSVLDLSAAAARDARTGRRRRSRDGEGLDGARAKRAIPREAQDSTMPRTPIRATSRRRRASAPRSARSRRTRRAGRRHDQARRDGESRTRCRPRCGRRSRRPSPRAGQSLSGRRRPRRSRRRCAQALAHPDGARPHSRQRLGRVDPDRHGRGARPGVDDARARAVVRHVPDECALRRRALRRRAARAGLLARRRRDARGDRARAAGARLSRVSQQSDRQSVRRRTTIEAILRARRGSSSSTRRTTRSRDASFLPRLAASFRISSWCAPCRRSAWRGCASAMRSRRPNGRRSSTRCASRIISTR